MVQPLGLVQHWTVGPDGKRSIKYRLTQGLSFSSDRGAAPTSPRRAREHVSVSGNDLWMMSLHHHPLCCVAAILQPDNADTDQQVRLQRCVPGVNRSQRECSDTPDNCNQ